MQCTLAEIKKMSLRRFAYLSRILVQLASSAMLPPRTRLCFTGPVEEVCRSELWRSFWPQSVNRKGTAKSYELNLREFCGNSNRSWPDSAMACGD